MSDLCTQCTRDDGEPGCSFGCPCADCNEGRMYEAFVTNPHRETLSMAECHAYMEYLRGGEVGLFQFDDDGEDDEREDGRYVEVDEYAERGLNRADFY